MERDSGGQESFENISYVDVLRELSAHFRATSEDVNAVLAQVRGECETAAILAELSETFSLTEAQAITVLREAESSEREKREAAHQKEEERAAGQRKDSTAILQRNLETLTRSFDLKLDFGIHLDDLKTVRWLAERIKKQYEPSAFAEGFFRLHYVANDGIEIAVLSVGDNQFELKPVPLRRPANNGIEEGLIAFRLGSSQRPLTMPPPSALPSDPAASMRVSYSEDAEAAAEGEGQAEEMIDSGPSSMRKKTRSDLEGLFSSLRAGAADAVEDDETD